MKNRTLTKVLPVAAGTVIALVAVLSWLVTARQDDAEFRLATATVADFEIRVNSVGTLDAERSQIISSTIKGDKGRVVWIVDEGTMVKKGDELLRFDPTPFEAEVQRLTGELKSREAVVEAQKQLTEWEKSQVEGSLNTAEYTTKDTRQEYARYLAYINDMEKLGAKGFKYPTEIAQARKKADQLQAKLEKNETDLDLVKKDGVYKVAGSMAALSKARTELETTRLALEEARSELQKTVLRAPADGIVVHFEQFRDSQKRKPRVGDTVWQNQPLLYLPDITSMIVRTQVREVDLHKIKQGQPVLIRVDAYPDLQFQGRVTGLGILATDGNEGVRGIKYFQLTVAVDGRDTRLRPGMTARVFITADIARKVLTVPVAAVFDEAGRKLSYRFQKGSGFKAVDVTVKRQNEDVVEIASGLAAGDRVSLIKP